MRFSVVIPVYNRAASIGPVLASVAAQDCGDFECLVVDDGSHDGAELAAAVATLNDLRFRLIHRANGGGGAARNTGIDAARGDHIAFLDSDDLFLPGKLSAFAGATDNDPAAAWYAPALVDRGRGRNWIRPDRAIRRGEAVGDYLFVANQVIQTSTLVVPRAAARFVRFDPTLPKGQDLDFCIRLEAAGLRFRMLDQPLTIWTDQGEAGRTSRNSGAHQAAWLARAGPRLSPRAVRGYRATVMVYDLGWRAPLRSLGWLADGWLRGGVAGRIILRQGLRAFLPRRAYRGLVDAVIALRGTARVRQ